jgi:hypothetical protein
MRVTLTETLDLKIVKLPFEALFVWNKKRGVTDKHWFTPSGVCKIYIGSLHSIPMGNLSSDDYAELMKEMKKAKCSILTDGRDYFTTGNQNILQINNMSNILYSAIKGWNAAKYANGWDLDETFKEFVLEI